jgi:hypothetical protein
MTLPEPAELERICKAIAALDAIISLEWDYRYFSYASTWAPGERMASMRNGSGDDYFIAFTPAGVFVKSFWHEYPHEDRDAIYRGLPDSLRKQLDEPVFETELVTWGGWHAGDGWTLRGNAKPLEEFREILAGDAQAYRSYAADYFELDVPLAAIERVLAGKPIDENVVQKILPDRSLGEVADELRAIGYVISSRRG